MADHSHSALTRRLRVFLCHVSEDKPVVRDIYQKLQQHNLEPWLDEKNLLPGENWELLIPEVIRQCDIVLICLSRTFLIKEGYGHYEINVVLEAAKRRPPNAIYHIPFRLDDCEVPSYLAGVHYASNFIPEDFEKLLAACEKRRAWLNTTQAVNIESIYKKGPDHTPGSFASRGDGSGVYRQSMVTDRQTPRISDGQGQLAQVAPPRRTENAQPPVRRGGARFGAPFPAIWNVPRRHSSFFTGRAAVLDQLFDAFRFENEAGMIPPQAITGLGGMGKTQVAAEYAYRFREEYQAVLWVRADTQENLLADFRAIAYLLKLPQELLQDQTNLVQTMREWFMGQSNWLLIFDNADNPGLADPFLPRAARGHILATTRAGAVVEWASQPLKLDALETEAGALCILRRAGQLREQQQLLDAPTARVEAARQLAELMKGLPLALEQAGAYINDTDCGVRKYLELYKKYRTEIQSRAYGEVLREYPESVASVWKISRSMVEQSNPAATELLRLCAFLSSEAIPDELILKGASALGPVLGPVAENELLFNQVISVLKRYSLLHREVDRETELTRLSIHRIMQEILIDEMDTRTRRLWAERAVRAVERASQSLLDPWPLLQAHARKCQQLIEQWHMTFAEAKRLQKWIEKFGK